MDKNLTAYLYRYLLIKKIFKLKKYFKNVYFSSFECNNSINPVTREQNLSNVYTYGKKGSAKTKVWLEKGLDN